MIPFYNTHIFFLVCNPSAKAQLNEDLIALGKAQYVRQSVMLPHDIVHSMYQFPEIFHHIWTGVPGELEQYWAYNLDLADELGIQEQENSFWVQSLTCPNYLCLRY